MKMRQEKGKIGEDGSDDSDEKTMKQKLRKLLLNRGRRQDISSDDGSSGISVGVLDISSVGDD